MGTSTLLHHLTAGKFLTVVTTECVSPTAMQVLTVMTSAVGSSSFHYRNLLISVVKASLEGSPSENFRYERGVDASIDLATSALARVPTTISGKATVPASATMHWSEKFRSVARRILLGHDRPTKVALKKGASPLGLGLGTRLGEVLFAVFFMEILQVLLEDLTEKCKNMGIAVCIHGGVRHAFFCVFIDLGCNSIMCGLPCIVVRTRRLKIGCRKS